MGKPSYTPSLSSQATLPPPEARAQETLSSPLAHAPAAPPKTLASKSDEASTDVLFIGEK